MEDVTSGGQETDFEKYKTDDQIVLKWLKEISFVEESKNRRAFERVGERTVKIYRNSQALQGALTQSGKTALNRIMFNILWSNVQILKPALFARMPKPVVERRHQDSDPVGRLACTMAERCVNYSLDSQKDRVMWAIKSAVEDRLLPGMGQCRVRYETEFDDATDEAGNPIVENGQAVQTPKPNTEKALIDYVFWMDYLFSSCRNPFEKRWEAFKLYMTRAELIKRFGEDIGKQVSLDYAPENTKRKINDNEGEFLKQALVYEIHDNQSKLKFWISKGYKLPLDVKPDTIRFKEFWSTPIPLLATTTTDSIYPTADYLIYEQLAEELDFVTQRISNLVECIRVIGITSAALHDKLKNILKLKDGDLFPSDNWFNFSEKGGLKAAIDWVPFDQAAAAIPLLVEYQQSLMGQIDLITGIPDLLRGATDPNETASAIQRKSHWILLKMQEKQADVQRFCRDLIGKVAEVIFEPGLFSDETIALMCGYEQMPPDEQELYQQALQLLRDDRLQTFRVDIETDSTIAEDEEEAIARWQQYMQVVQAMVSEVQGISQYRPELMKPVVESAKAATRILRTGRSLEGAWENAWQQIEDNDKAAAEQAAQNPPPPDPNVIKAQVAQGELELKQRQQQFEEWYKPQELQQQNSIAQLQAEVESNKLQLQGMSIQNKSQIDQLLLNLEAQKIQLAQVDSMLTQREKMLTEERLQREEHLNTIKMFQEHAVATRESSAKAQPAQPVNVNTGTVHITPPAPVVEAKPKRKRIKVVRAPDGSLHGESIEIAPDAESQAEDLNER